MTNNSLFIVTSASNAVFVNSHSKNEIYNVRILKGANYFCVKETPKNYKVALTCGYTNKLIYVLINKHLFTN